MLKHEANHVTPLLDNSKSVLTHSPCKRQNHMTAREALLVSSLLPVFHFSLRTGVISLG